MRFYFSVLFFLFYSNVKATHIVGGEMWYDYISPGTYKIYIALFRDCASSGAQYDNPMSLGIFNSNNVLLQEVSVSFPGSNQLPINFSNPCVTAPGGICVEKTVYTTTLNNLPPINGGYTLAYTRCCRGPNVVNLVGPDNVGITITTHIPGLETGLSHNNSPRFATYPPLVLCAGIDFNFNHSATDPDGDVLVYDLVAPFVGGSSSAPMPQPPPNPPYGLAPWQSGYNAAAPLGAGANLTIDPNTGVLNATPSQLGLFAVGVRVREYRAGVLVGETRRDFLWKIVSCVIQLTAEIPPQNLIGTGNGPCTGLTVQFGNESFNATNYAWNFGDLTTANDVSSSSAPSYTFPANGTYVVTLIANPGWPCSDTTTETFVVSEKIVVFALSSDSVCIDNNMIDFEAYGYGDPSTILLWNFGPHATPPTGTGQFVNNVVFDTSGFIPITINASIGSCNSDNADTILIYGHAKINFDIPPGLQCAPYKVTFLDSSFANVPLTYLWEFGDGTTSTVEAPFHVYPNVGIYDVKLTIETHIGCIDSVVLFKPGLIKVNPSPISLFNVTPNITDVFNTFIQFTDQSFDSDYMKYDLDDSTETLERNPLFSYYTSGSHFPMQTVINEYGCRDSSVQEIYVKPYTTIYVPNTFTPDNFGYNNIWLPIVLDVKSYELVIFNRWGELFFETTEPSDGWNGMNGKLIAPEGTYTYRIRYEGFQKNGTEEIVGHFNLIR
jgi:gliding motility-associated-like protein